MITLADIALVRVGHTYRGSLRGAHSGDTAIIQTKDASRAGLASCGQLARTDLPKLAPHLLLSPGDLIFRARGPDFQAVVVPAIPERTICIAPLMYIRLHDTQQVLPDYLEWYINLQHTQATLSRFARGDLVKMINLQAIHKLPLLLPERETQRRIVEIYHLQLESQLVQEKLNVARLQYMEAALLDLASGKTGDGNEN